MLEMITRIASGCTTHEIRTDWDEIDSSRLLPLVGVRETTNEFGFLLRHYWMPSTELLFQVKTEQFLPNGSEYRSEHHIIQKMVHCDADRCVWRERIQEMNDPDEETFRFFPAVSGEHLCEYNRSKQAFSVRYPKKLKCKFHVRVPSRRYAMLRQPILTPLLPIPVGFQWHVKSDDECGGFMDFCLESAERIGDMTVLFIRRKGSFVLNDFFRWNVQYAHRYRVLREGITAYVLERSMILEDRTVDRIVSEQHYSPLAEMVTYRTQKLVKSALPLQR